jgi:hypothetical protein
MMLMIVDDDDYDYHDYRCFMAFENTMLYGSFQSPTQKRSKFLASHNSVFVLPDSRSRPSHGSASRSANGAEFSLNTTGPPIQRESEWATTSAKLL